MAGDGDGKRRRRGERVAALAGCRAGRISIGLRNFLDLTAGATRWSACTSPLYYRVAAGLCTRHARTGLDAEAAARLAGRGISIAGLVATLAEASSRSSWGWVAVCPVVGRTAGRGDADLRRITFRGAARHAGNRIQTWGVVLFLGVLNAKSRANGRFCSRSSVLRVAACVKQHFVMAPAISASSCSGRGSGPHHHADGGGHAAVGLGHRPAFTSDSRNGPHRGECRALRFELPGQSTEIPLRHVGSRPPLAPGNLLEMRGVDPASGGGDHGRCLLRHPDGGLTVAQSALIGLLLLCLKAPWDCC